MSWLSQLFGMFRPLQWWIVIAPLVTTFAYVRVYRLLNCEYRSLSASNDLEQPIRPA